MEPNTHADSYLEQYSQALDHIDTDYALAFVVAGTDTLASDPLGGLSLSIYALIEREKLTYNKLKMLGIPTVFLGGGGYSTQSAAAVSQSILACL